MFVPLRDANVPIWRDTCFLIEAEWSVRLRPIAGRSIIVGMKPARAATRRYLPGSPFNTPPVVRPVKEFAAGDQVTHDRYGLGRVLSADESGVFVDFGTQQERIAAPYSKLTKL